jgi:hypothetical protein
MNIKIKFIYLIILLGLHSGCMHYEMTSYGYTKTRAPIVFLEEQPCAEVNQSKVYLRCFLESRKGLVLIPTGELTLTNISTGATYSSEFGANVHKIEALPAEYQFSIKAIGCDTLLFEYINLKPGTSLQIDVVMHKGIRMQKFLVR